METETTKEKMSKADGKPEDWKTFKIKEIGEVILGTTPSTKVESNWDGSIPFITPGDVSGYKIRNTERTISEEGLDKKRKLPKNSIVVSCIGNIGRVGITQMETAMTNQQINSIIPYEDVADNYFTLFLTDYFGEGFKNYASQTTVPILNKTNFSNIELKIPPLPEQRKIASTLTTVQDAIEQTEAVIQATRELKKSMMKHLFTYGPVPVDQTDQIELKETDIGPIPSSWELVEVDKVFDFSRKPRGLDIEKDDEIPFIPMENISEVWNEIDLYQDKKWSEINSGSYIEKGDLIVAKITPSFENGKQAMLNDLPNEFGYATTEIWALHPNEEKRVLPELLFYYLKKPSIRNSIANKMEGSTGRQRVPKSVLRNLLIPLPNLETQRKIVDDFLTLDNKIKQESDKIESLKGLFNSLLENLMTAKVRVV